FIGVFLALIPPFIWGWDWETTIYRALIFLVVASPCALMAAIMPTLLSGIANGARQGILFKSSATLEALGQIKAIAFDKTGTLTTGQLQVTQIIPVTERSESYLLTVAATLEAYSEHPIGEAIVRAAQQRNLFKLEASDVRAEAGQGIEGTIEGKRVWVGKLVGLETNTSLTANLEQTCSSLEEQGNTVIWIIQADRLLGAIAVADTVRPEAQTAIAQLKKLGIKQIIMLTGDNERTAHQIAQTVGIDQVYAELLPEDKIHILRRLQKQYRTVAMVGDGINDAPALAQASVGIAMGVTGTDVALETADVILMADRLDRLERAIRLGRRAQSIVKQNIIFAIAFIILLLTANFVGGITLPIGVIGHEGSTLVVTLSGLRLLRG
ncbi:heavy metal translocating P-type ATPase, partial [Pleurocapsa sp. CCALA 161]|uniref:heavy metal translocating P-type ATPase n=1 Tax=Pleurocapsa sp. CCALA 161 TaxID=2107688 RepID=UPI000D426C73